MRILSLMMVVVLAWSMNGISANAAGRGLKVVLKANEQPNAPPSETVDLYRSSKALVIGIDNYTNGWPKLSSAVTDAKLVANSLELRGFDVTLETNLDSVGLKEAFEQFFVLKGEDPEARLFVWFAGHGYSEGGEGFLVPTDAPNPSAGAKFKLKALSMRRFGEYVRLAQSKHSLAIFDSCFSGTIFNSQRALPPAAITSATTYPVRQFLTSGDAGQRVSDDGKFRKLFIRALNGEESADANGDGYLTGSELGLFITDRVTNLTQGAQTPRYGKLRDSEYDRGDFVFATLGRPYSNESTPNRLSTGAMQENMFWGSIKDSRNPSDFKAYLAQYPNGVFRTLASNKLASLGNAQATPTPSRPASAGSQMSPNPASKSFASQLEGEWKVEVDWYEDTFGYCVFADPIPFVVQDGVVQAGWDHSKEDARFDMKVTAGGKIDYTGGSGITAIKFKGAFETASLGKFDIGISGIENMSCGGDVILTR